MVASPWNDFAFQLRFLGLILFFVQMGASEYVNNFVLFVCVASTGTLHQWLRRRFEQVRQLFRYVDSLLKRGGARFERLPQRHGECCFAKLHHVLWLAVEYYSLFERKGQQCRTIQVRGIASRPN